MSLVGSGRFDHHLLDLPVEHRLAIDEEPGARTSALAIRYDRLVGPRSAIERKRRHSQASQVQLVGALLELVGLLQNCGTGWIERHVDQLFKLVAGSSAQGVGGAARIGSHGCHFPVTRFHSYAKMMEVVLDRATRLDVSLGHPVRGDPDKPPERSLRAHFGCPIRADRGTFRP